MKKLIYYLPLFIVFQSFSQTDSTAVDEFSEYGDADDKKVKLFCSQKVNYLSPTRFISVGYEYQGAFDLESAQINSSAKPAHSDVSNARGLRLAFNTPVISRSNFILSLGLTYWNTSLSKGSHTSTSTSEFKNNLFENGIRTTGLNATIFKPLNQKSFLIFQGNADLNGNYKNFDEIDFGNQMTYSAAAIYGWKKSDNLMWGIGAARTYRLGELIYVPVLLYNKTFNPKWGVELLLPSRGAVRRNFGTTSMLLFGYELEGNTYYMNRIGFLRRGEVKPRITYEKQIKNFIWFSAQAGMRVNARFNVFDTQNPVKNELARYTNTLQNPFYLNFSINLVSP
jgi:hypothetical protein